MMMEVKPLEWEEFERGSGTVYAISIFGRYSAWREGEYGRYETPEGYRSRSIDRGIEAAKAAAQADYEARIRSALTSPASEVEQIIAASTRMAKRLGVAFEIDPAKVEQFIRGTSPASGTTRATAWENIHNGAIRRVEPSDPENYIALGPITSPASGERDAPSGYVLVPAEPTEGMLAAGMDSLAYSTGEPLSFIVRDVLFAYRAMVAALRMEGK